MGAQFERAVVIHNPSGARLAEACEDELRNSKLFGDVLRLGSVAGGRTTNAELLMSKLQPGDRLGMVCGDGTFRDVVGALLLPEVVETIGPDIAVASLAGGNARDIGRATQRRRHAAPSRIFRNSTPVQARGLEATIHHRGGTIHNHALSYIGVGKSAIETDRINGPEYRLGTPGIRDMRILADSLTNRHYFTASINDQEQQDYGDITFAKGSRMAKYGRFPVTHWEDRYRVMTAGRGVLAATMVGAGLLIGQTPGETMSSPCTLTFESATLMHFDGDPPVPVCEEDQLTISLSEQSYTLLTTRG